MRYVIWTFRLFIFLVLLGFAVKNDQLVNLKFYFGQTWDVNLVFVMLVAFIVGSVLGATASLLSTLVQRREVSRLKKQLGKLEKQLATHQQTLDT